MPRSSNSASSPSASGSSTLSTSSKPTSTSHSSATTKPAQCGDSAPPSLNIPALDDPRDYTLASLAWQYSRIASALASLDHTTLAVRSEFKHLASELALRAAQHPASRPHTPCIPPMPDQPRLTYITALARYRVRINPRSSFAAWKDNETRMERALRWYRDVAQGALAQDKSSDSSGAHLYGSLSGSSTGASISTSPRAEKRHGDEMEIESANQSTPPLLRGKHKRARHDTVAAPTTQRRSTRRSVAPQRFGAAAS